MRGYLDHKKEIDKLTAVATKFGVNINSDVFDSPERLASLGIPGLTMRKVAEDTVIDMFARIVNYARKDALRFRDVVKSCANDMGFSVEDSDFDNIPIMALDPKDNSKVFVYPTLVLDKLGQDPFHWSRSHLVAQAKTFLTTYFSDIQDAKRKQAWAPTHRAKSRLLRRESMDITRAIPRYLTALSSRYSADRIRDLAIAVKEFNSPVELLYADTDPEDFYHMYATGPDSCMKDNGNRKFSFMSKLKKKWHPTSIFASIPYVKGVFIKRGNSVVARTFIYDTEHFLGTSGAKKIGGKWAYGRVYSSTPKYTTLLIGAMTNVGYVSLRDKGFSSDLMSKEYTAEIQLINVDEAESAALGIAAGKYVPVPYLDDHPADALIEIDEGSDKLRVTFNSKKNRNVQFRSQDGFLPASTFLSCVCYGCGEEIPTGQAVFGNDGRSFHNSAECISAAGYVHAYNNMGNQSIVNTNTPGLIKDVVNGKYFLASATARYNILPFLRSLKEIDEVPDGYTSQGTIVEINGYVCRVSAALYESLRSNFDYRAKNVDKYGTIASFSLQPKYITIGVATAVVITDGDLHIDRATLRELERIAA